MPHGLRGARALSAECPCRLQRARQARRIADEQAFDFACGADQPVIDAGTVPLPPPAGGEGGE